MEINGFLRAANDAEYYLRPEKYPENYDGWLYSDGTFGADYGVGLFGVGTYGAIAEPIIGYLRPEGRLRTSSVVISFPTQYAGLRFFKGTVQELCLVDTADAPAGDQWRVRKGGTTYAVYLVATTDPNASHVRVHTNDGIKAARLKT